MKHWLDYLTAAQDAMDAAERAEDAIDRLHCMGLAARAIYRARQAVRDRYVLLEDVERVDRRWWELNALGY